MKETEFNSFADDNTLYDVGNTIEEAISSLQESSDRFPIIECKEILENFIWS